MATHAARRRADRRRLRPGPRGLVLGACAVAATLMVLSVNGTLSDWTSAILSNDTNTVASTTAVILQEVGPDGTASHSSQTCRSSDGVANTSTCTTINKYGGTSTPLAPGGSQVADVVFTNLGAANGSSFVLTPGTCTSSPSTGTPTPNNLCTTDLTVAVSCSNGSTYAPGSAWTDLVYPAGAASSIPTLTHAAGLAAGASATCRFTVALPANASVLDQGVTVSHPLSWTLSK
ncbi:hypothetical protein FHP29_11370 [Nocardioides albidus]|uniref:Uncharacterized protein n=1 Tax=Nocardioides albidus TaxID=1517589 RepID=A0A5C4VUI3_9ACTN|nr:hypothetical protein [Nocardioides albidus]TNM39487.1 hypothetical protein FHP29_11370 [Nocardioides albidus]